MPSARQRRRPQMIWRPIEMPRQVTHELGLDWTREESARQDFVAGMRQYLLSDVARFMRTAYEQRVEPAFNREHGRGPREGREVHRAIKGETLFKFYSRMRSDTQRMVYRSVIPGIERQIGDLAAHCRALGERDVGGTLTLDPELQIPRNITALDVHWMPGCYDTEYFEDDVAAGALYEQGLSVFFLGFLGDNHDDVGRSAARYLHARYPDFAPRRMLEIGCTVGGSTLPFKETFADLEIHATDPCAPVLRYAHGRAQSFGVPVHFHQMRGDHLKFADSSFDFIWSSQVLHELPANMLKQCLAECYRVLKPGGLMLHVELPPNSKASPYDQFYVDWDAYYNNEPWYKQLRDMDLKALVSEAGFSPDRYVELIVPSLHSQSREIIFGAGRDCGAERPAKQRSLGLSVADPSRNPGGVTWFSFGAWK
jgi:ubiquinone/menaquinone biosynthesis C-methylase UbiE